MSFDFSPRGLFPNRLDPNGNEMCLAVASVMKDIYLAIGFEGCTQENLQQAAHDRYDFLCLTSRISLPEAQNLVSLMCQKKGVSSENARKYYAFLLSPLDENKLA